jgi:hypothetical protein
MINLTPEQITDFVQRVTAAKVAEAEAYVALRTMLTSAPAQTETPAPVAEQPVAPPAAAAEPAAPPPPPPPAEQPAQQTAPPAQQPAGQLSFDQFNATVVNVLAGPAGAYLKTPGPDGAPPIKTLMLRYTAGKGGAANIDPVQYGNFLNELNALAAAAGAA